MRASRHVFMSFEDFFGDQDTFVSDQTSERRPPSVQTREKHATWNFFLPQLRFKQRFNRFVEKITPCRETSLVPTKEESHRTKMFTLRWTLHFPPFTVFGYFRVP